MMIDLLPADTAEFLLLEIEVILGMKFSPHWRKLRYRRLALTQ